MSQKRLAMAMLDDVVEILAKFPGACERYIATFVPHMLVGAMSTDSELRQAALFGKPLSCRLLCLVHGAQSFLRDVAGSCALRCRCACLDPSLVLGIICGQVLGQPRPRRSQAS